jgi:hypothetical protein
MAKKNPFERKRTPINKIIHKYEYLDGGQDHERIQRQLEEREKFHAPQR